MSGADLTAPPPASEENIPAVLSGTLKKVRDSGVITIGYREASFPFSFVRPGAPRPLGYSIDLCLGVVEEIVRELHGEAIRVAYAPVTSETRIEAVRSGAVDLECGSTTGNIERQKSVAFSPIIYVAGTKLLVKRASGIRSYHDLGGKTLVVTSGTTNEAAMKQLNDKYRLGITIVAARDHDESYAMLADGRADAFATDDVLLYGFIAAKKAARHDGGGRRFHHLRALRADVPARRSVDGGGGDARVHHHGADAGARGHLPALVPAAGADRRAAESADERAARRGLPRHGGRGLAHDPEKWVPVFGKDHAPKG